MNEFETKEARLAELHKQSIAISEELGELEKELKNVED